MLELAVVAVSTGFLFTISLVLISCASCRRFFDKKKENENEERVNIPEIKIDIGEDKTENGITNPGYQEPEVKETKAEIVNEVQDEVKVSESDDNTAVTAQPTSHDQQNVEQENQTEAKITVEISEQEAEQNKQIQPKIEDGQGTTNTAFEDNIESEHDDSQHEKSKDITTENSDVQETTTKKEEKEEEDAKQEETDVENVNTIDDCTPDEQDEFRYSGIVFQSDWREPVLLSDLVETGLVSKDIADEVANELQEAKAEQQNENDEREMPEKIAKLLRGDEPIAGIIVADTGEKKSIVRSEKDGILRRGTAISLLEAQAATGNIIDPVTGRKMSVKDAAQLGLFDRVYETILLRAERAVTGYKFRATDHTLTLYEAMKRGLVVDTHAYRLWEAQNATGGIVDFRINIRLPLDVALKRGLIDAEIKGKLEDENGEETKTFFDPNTEQNVTYKELIRRSVVDNDTGLRLYPLEKMTKKRVNYGGYSGRSSLASSKNVSRSNSKENIPAALASS